MTDAAELEAFRLALQSAARALSGDLRLQVDFAGKCTLVEGRNLHLPAQSRAPRGAAAARLRGAADLFALRHLHHDPVLHAGARPGQATARALFDSWEDVRVEIVGSRDLPGASRNIGALLRSRLRPLGADEQDAGHPSVAAVAWELRSALLARSAPPVGEEGVQGSGSPLRAADVERFRRDLASQHAFARSALAWLHAAGLIADEPSREPATDVAFGRGDKAMVSCPADSGHEERPLETRFGSVEDDAGLAGAGGNEGTGSGGADAGAGAIGAAASQRAGYRVFDRSQDEVITATALGEAERSALLRVQLDAKSAQLRAQIGPRLRRMMRRMAAVQPQRWHTSLEDGPLDPARLAAVVANPLIRRVHRQRTRAGHATVGVTLLVDNSGSMRGAPIASVAAAVDVLAPLLERRGVRLEVLGFTTGAWMGGRVRERWVAAGSPPLPGRLNQLRHIVYKHAEQPWAMARRSLGVMLDERLLRENIDGEALAWAHARLLARTHRRGMLVMLCDGSPSDTATEQASGSGYLHRHLHDVIGRISALPAVELLAVVTDPCVAAMYPHAVLLSGPEDWGGALTDVLAKRLSIPGPARR